jgi:hypothetical protein
MSKELDVLKHDLKSRYWHLARISGTTDKRLEINRTIQVIRHIESLFSCPMCKHWIEGECEEYDPCRPWEDMCSRSKECVDYFVPKGGE